MIRLILLTHPHIGEALLHTALQLYRPLPIPTTLMSIGPNDKPENVQNKLSQLVDYTEEELLVLTDLYGATPYNRAAQLLPNRKMRILTGLNLPMLLKAFNYQSLPLNDLAEKAFAGGLDGIQATAPNNEDKN